MAALRVFFCLLAFTSARVAADTTAHDVEYHKIITFEVKGDARHGYELRSEVEVAQVFVSDRATDSTDIHIFEPPYAEVDDLKASLDNDKISDKNIYSRHVRSRDIFLSDDNVWVIDLARKPKPGMTLRYSYKEKYIDIAYLPLIAIPNVDYIKEFVVAVKHPEEVSVDFDLFFPTDELSYRIDQSDPKKAYLIFDPIQPTKRLPYFPFNRTRGVVMISLSQEAEAVNPTPVADFVQWYARRVPEIAPGLSELKSSLLDDRLDSAAGVWQKLDIINDFVRENIRYISDSRYPNGIIPHEPSMVLDRQYGDCKDRAYLVKALADLAGIKVNMAAISTDPSPHFRGVHWGQFNHVICVYTSGDSSVFFDPTARFYNLGDIPEYLIDQPALVLDSTAPRFLTVPTADTLPALSVHVTASTDSLVNAQATVVFRKDFLSKVRHASEELASDDYRLYLANRVSGVFYKIAFDKFVQVSDDKQSATFSARANLVPFIIQTESNRYAPRCAFTEISKDLFERADDSLPLYFEQTSYIALDIELRPGPQQFTSDSTVIDGSGTADFKAIARQTDNGGIRLSYSFRRPVKILDHNDKQNFLRFAGEYLNNKNNMFIFDGRNK